MSWFLLRPHGFAAITQRLFSPTQMMLYYIISTIYRTLFAHLSAASAADVWYSTPLLPSSLSEMARMITKGMLVF